VAISKALNYLKTQNACVIRRQLQSKVQRGRGVEYCSKLDKANIFILNLMFSDKAYLAFEIFIRNGEQSKQKIQI
jgi:hypothetical protein